LLVPGEKSPAKIFVGRPGWIHKGGKDIESVGSHSKKAGIAERRTGVTGSAIGFGEKQQSPSFFLFAHGIFISFQPLLKRGFRSIDCAKIGGYGPGNRKSRIEFFF